MGAEPGRVVGDADPAGGGVKVGWKVDDEVSKTNTVEDAGPFVAKPSRS